jgi:hypothetical protein
MKSRFHPRSRLPLQIDNLSEVHDLQALIRKEQDHALRSNNESALDDHAEAVLVRSHDLPIGFGHGDNARRTCAMWALNIHILASAASEIEQEELRRLLLKQVPVLPNREAYGLQILAYALEQNLQNLRSTDGTDFARFNVATKGSEMPSPLIKGENPQRDVPPHLQPQAPAAVENVWHQHLSLARLHESSNAQGVLCEPQMPTTPNKYTQHANHLSECTTFDPSTAFANAPAHHFKSGQSSGVFGVPYERVQLQHDGNEDEKELSNANISSRSHLASIPDAQHGQPLPSAVPEGYPSPLQQRMSSDANGHADPPVPHRMLTDDAQRRRSDTYSVPNHDSAGHERKRSAPVTHQGEGMFQTQSPSPSQLQASWQQHHHTIHPVQPLGLQYAVPYPASPAILYAVPPYSVPSYVVYGPPPPPAHHAQATSPPLPPQHGPIFFGPPPPPQFGPPSGPQQYYPWYRQ